MIEQLIERTFATRNAVQIEHWKTKSYAQHSALGSLYDDLAGHIDGIIEAHQGAFGLVSVGELDRQPKVSNIISHLEDDLIWIGKNRKAICGGIQAIDNLLQGLEGVYLSAIYKLKNLS